MYRSKKGLSENGAWPLVSDVKDGFVDLEVVVPCGRCIFCRLAISRGKTIRIIHELESWDVSSFLTLTYDDAHLPLGDLGVPTLTRGQYGDVTRFLKRLRKRLPYPIKYFQCGEYGEDKCRPHYHMILFGCDFSEDRILRETNPNLYQSPLLDACWRNGAAVIGTVTWDSASYVASYCVKKLTGPDAVLTYDHNAIIPPYMTCSLGLGKEWATKWKDDIYPRDTIVVNGHECKPPKYYDRVLEGLDGSTFKDVVKSRQDLVADRPHHLWQNAFPAAVKKESFVKMKVSKL